MTNFDAFVAAGPKELAYAFSESKIRMAEEVLKKFGIEFKFPDELREEMYREHYDFLTKEI